MFQIHRYNVLLRTIKASLVELEKGIKGLVVMSSDLEEVFNCIHKAQVPPLWGKAYPSQKALGAWTRDLILRVDQFSQWATTTHPPVLFWLSGFTFPTGFLTAVLQTAARKNNVINTCFECLLGSSIFKYAIQALTLTSHFSAFYCTQGCDDIHSVFVHSFLCRCLLTPYNGIFM